MNLGELRHKISIKHAATNVDEKGHPVSGEVVFAQVWAAKRGLGSREYYAAAAVQRETEVIFTIRYLAGINSTSMWIEESNGTKYDIRHPVDKDGHKCWLEIRAKVKP